MTNGLRIRPSWYNFLSVNARLDWKHLLQKRQA